MRIYQIIKKAAASVANEDDASSSGDAGTVVLVVRNDAGATLTDADLDYTAIAADAAGRIGVTPLGGTFTVTVTAMPALPAGTDNIGDVDVVTVPAPLSTTGNGTAATAMRVTLASDSTGTTAVTQATASSLNAQVVGNVAHDAADSGNPVKIGLKAQSALPTAATTTRRTDAIGDLWGRQLVAHIDPAMQKHANKNYTSQQTGTDVITPTSGKKLAITSVFIGSYGTTAGRLILWFGDNADTTFTQDTDQVLLAGSFAPSASSKPGVSFTPATPVFCTTADRELHITTDAALSCDVTIEYYEW